MMTARRIVMRLVASGVIPEEYTEVATEELHRELTRRSKRVTQTLAALVSLQQLAVRFSQFAS